MKKIFSLFLAVVCCSMVFGQIISVTDGSLADWKNVPSEYLFKTECAPNAMYDGLKSVQVYVDMTYINLLVEVNDEVVTDLEWTPFHVFINSDNSSSTGGYGDLWKDADTDLMLETAIYSSGYVNSYNPGVFKWWGANGENGWWWTDPNGEPTPENGWGALVPEGSKPIGNAQMVDGKIEIQLDYTQIPMPFDETTFTLGFDIQQAWNSVGVLPNANEDENGNNVLAEKLRVYVHPQNKTEYAAIDGIKYKVTSNAELHTAEVFSLLNKEASITEIAIPKTIALDGITYTVTSIGISAFRGCSSLTSITIPNSVTSIGDDAFSGCTFTKDNFINHSTLDAETNNYWGATIIKGSEINGLIIRNDTVVDCRENVTSVEIPNYVKGIGDYAFSHCSSLTSVTIPNSVTSIGFGAFQACSSLTSITIPNSVTSIGYFAFYNCSSLTSMVVESGNSTYDSRDNCNAIIETATNTLIISCQNTVIPNSVTSIGGHAFSLCSSLTSITIPNSVTSIGENAFYNCSSLDTIISLSMTPPILGEDVFLECNNPTLFVPCEALEAYQAHEQWGQFTNIQCIASEEVETDDVMITPSTTSVSITWPTAENAYHYVIEIKKDGEVFCTLTFNADGQVLNIAFAPSREGNNRPVQYAEQGGNGYRFTLTGLTEATKYAYDITTKDAANNTIATYSGEFTTKGGTTTDMENIQSPVSTCQKVIRNGQLIIVRDGKTYTIMGAEIQ